jgi:hypothetical protein
MELYVQYSQICTNDYHSGEQYGDWSTSYDFAVHGVTHGDRSRWEGLAHQQELFNVQFDINIGDTVYVLWMTYSSGDSFGNADGMGEILWVFKDQAIATIAKNMWEQGATKDGAHSIRFGIDDGSLVELSNPACGYFEDCGSVELTPFVITP